MLAATNRWTSWSAGARLVSARDLFSYREIALAAPSLPSGHIANQYAQVFVLNWLVGLVHAALNIGIDGVFRVISILLMVAAAAALAAAVNRSETSTPVFAVCLALFILNTYSLRYYLLALGYVTDLSFDVCMGVVAFGLVTHRFRVVLAAVTVAVLARQTAIPAAVAVAVVVAFTSPWRAAPTQTRVARAAATIIAPLIVFAIVLKIAHPFSVSDTPGLSGLTVLGTLKHLPGSFGSLGSHLLRVINPFFAVAALFAAVLVARRRLVTAPPPIPSETWACLILGAGVSLQALALNPNYSGHPERLAVLALIPFVVALAYLIRDLERAGHGLPAAHATAITAILAIGSLHYLYTWLGPSTANQGGALQLIAAVAAAAVLYRGLENGPHPGPTSQPYGRKPVPTNVT